MEQDALDLGISPDEVIPPRDRPAPNNRGGRPRGTKGKHRDAVTKLFRAHYVEAYEYLMRGVREGDPTATQIYWNRVYPKPNRLQVQLEQMPAVKTPADARAAMAELLSRALGGELPTDEAVDLARLLGMFLQANSIHVLEPADSAAAEESSGRELLLRKLTRVIEDREHSTEPVPPPAVVNEEKIEPPGSPGEPALETRVERAFQAGDIAELEAIAAELEKPGA